MISNLNIWSYLPKDNYNMTDNVIDKQTENTENIDESNTLNTSASNQSSVSEKANKWGTYLFEAGKNATTIAAKQVSNTAKQIRKNVSSSSSASIVTNIMERGNIISNFTEEQLKFKNEKRSMEQKRREACLPWIDALNQGSCSSINEQNLKLKILSVSSDERNFTRNPPVGSDFDFNCSLYYPVALLLLEEDAKLSEMRFKLVPKKIKEEVFWRNYFYRISLIKQSMMQGEQSGTTAPDSEQQEADVIPLTKGNAESSNDSMEPLTTRNTGPGVQELKTGLIKSGQFSNQAALDNNEDWEAELQKELSEFELINEDNEKDPNDLEEKVDFDDLEKEIMSELEK